jgi:hypothetical protein
VVVESYGSRVGELSLGHRIDFISDNRDIVETRSFTWHVSGERVWPLS